MERVKHRPQTPCHQTGARSIHNGYNIRKARLQDGAKNIILKSKQIPVSDKHNGNTLASSHEGATQRMSNARSRGFARNGPLSRCGRYHPELLCMFFFLVLALPPTILVTNRQVTRMPKFGRHKRTFSTFCVKHIPLPAPLFAASPSPGLPHRHTFFFSLMKIYNEMITLPMKDSHSTPLMNCSTCTNQAPQAYAIPCSGSLSWNQL